MGCCGVRTLNSIQFPWIPNGFGFFFWYNLASSILPEELSLTSTPKRLSGSLPASTPTSGPAIESIEAAEAKAALKQVWVLAFHMLTKSDMLFFCLALCLPLYGFVYFTHLTAAGFF